MILSDRIQREINELDAPSHYNQRLVYILLMHRLNHYRDTHKGMIGSLVSFIGNVAFIALLYVVAFFGLALYVDTSQVYPMSGDHRFEKRLL